MRPLPFLLVTLLGAGCSQGVLSPLPASDGYGPAGGGERSPGTPSGGGTPAPAPTSTTPPSQPPPSDDGGDGAWRDAGAGDAGSSGIDAGTVDAGRGYDAGPSGEGGAVSALLPLCVSQINQFRDQNQEIPLSESSDLEAYAAAAATADAQSGVLHGYFDDTGGGGVAATEDELDGARFDPGATAQQTMEQGLLDEEQNNGQAAANLLDTQFSQVGCGFAQDLSGNWWVVIGLR
jgi:cysteine-rich secretory family protein